MSVLSNEIDALIKNSMDYYDSTLSLSIKFPGNFIGFQGHFPNNPVLPGVVMIKVMIKMYEIFKKKPYVLSQIKQTKFMGPVFANDVVLFTQNTTQEKDEIKLTGKILKSDKIISKISLVLKNQELLNPKSQNQIRAKAKIINDLYDI